MTIRPVNDSGDILPVLSSSAMVTGPEAVVALVRDRLNLLTGEWWENPAWGNAVVDMLRDSRLTEADTRALANYITSYIRQTDGVLEVEDVEFSVEGKFFSYSCRVDTEDGDAEIDYSL